MMAIVGSLMVTDAANQHLTADEGRVCAVAVRRHFLIGAMVERVYPILASWRRRVGSLYDLSSSNLNDKMKLGLQVMIKKIQYYSTH